MYHARLVVGLCAALLLSASPDHAAAPQQSAPPAAADQSRFRSGTELVTVDVSVFGNDSRPLTGLGAADFVVLVDGKPRPIAVFQFLVSTTTRAPSPHLPESKTAAAGLALPGEKKPERPLEPPPWAAEAGPPVGELSTIGRRHFVVVIDREHIETGGGVVVLKAAARFVEDLPASDFVAVWTIPGQRRVSFNESHSHVARKIRSASGRYRMPFVPSAGPRGLEPGDYVSDAMTGLAMERLHQSEVTLTALQDLVVALRPLEGPKHIILVTGGPVLQWENLTQVRQVANLAALSRVQIHALHARPPFAGARADLQKLPSVCRDPSVLSTGAAAYELALLTGGFTDTPSQTLIEGQGFDLLARQLSAWYLLGFEPLPEEHDGRTHRIEVTLASRTRASIRARRAFFLEKVVDTAATAAIVPPPATVWDGDAEARASRGMLPFGWLPDWFDAVDRFRDERGSPTSVQQVSVWEADRLEGLDAWLRWLFRREARGIPLPAGFVPGPMRAAAALHTWAAMNQADHRPGPTTLGHLRVADALLARFDDEPAEGRSIRRVWYEAVVTWLLTFGRFSEASAVLSSARKEFPEDGRVALLQGRTGELLASPIVDEWVADRAQHRARQAALRRTLKDTESRYREALRLSPGLVSARLHLARVLDQLGEPQNARAELERVLSADADPDTRFLAWMFLGRLHERAGRLPEATAAYEHASTLSPSAQSALVALAHVQDREGNRSAARERLAALRVSEIGPVNGAATDREADTGRPVDPWWDYYLGSDESLKTLLQTFLQRCVS